MAETLETLVITIKERADGVTVSSHLSSGPALKTQILNASRKQIDAFTSKVRHAAHGGRKLDDQAMAEARALHESLFHGPLSTLRGILEATRPQFLIRLVLRGAWLQGVPWEALCTPETYTAFLGTSAQEPIARGVESGKLDNSRCETGKLRVVVIAPLPSADQALRSLKDVLAVPLGSGAIELIELSGEDARRRTLLDNLRHLNPHVVHFIGHGGMLDGKPNLCLAEEESTENREKEWMPVGFLAQQLALRLHTASALQLVVLEACSGAEPGVFGSAAEVLLDTCAHAVVAHLWPVKEPVARELSERLYRALLSRKEGDIVASLAAARRVLSQESAQAFSPVVYLRSNRSVLFDFTGLPWTPPKKQQWRADVAIHEERDAGSSGLDKSPAPPSRTRGQRPTSREEWQRPSIPAPSRPYAPARRSHERTREVHPPVYAPIPYPPGPVQYVAVPVAHPVPQPVRGAGIVWLFAVLVVLTSGIAAAWYLIPDRGTQPPPSQPECYHVQDHTRDYGQVCVDQECQGGFETTRYSNCDVSQRVLLRCTRGRVEKKKICRSGCKRPQGNSDDQCQ